MTLTCKFDFEQRVRHRLNEFEGSVIGIAIRPTCIEYEVLPVTDNGANWRSSVWIDERFLEAHEVNINCGGKSDAHQ